MAPLREVFGDDLGDTWWNAAARLTPVSERSFVEVHWGRQTNAGSAGLITAGLKLTFQTCPAASCSGYGVRLLSALLGRSAAARVLSPLRQGVGGTRVLRSMLRGDHRLPFTVSSSTLPDAGNRPTRPGIVAAPAGTTTALRVREGHATSR